MYLFRVYNILRSKDFSDEEAQLIAEAIDHKENLATKEDISTLDRKTSDLRTELKEDISKIREDMLKMEGSLRGNIVALEIKTERGVHRLMLMLVGILAVILVTNPGVLALIATFFRVAH